jgi:hypothetical protein
MAIPIGGRALYHGLTRLAGAQAVPACPAAPFGPERRNDEGERRMARVLSDGPVETKQSWARPLAWLALALSLGALLAAMIGAVGAGQGSWHFRTGFTVLRYAFFAGIAGSVLALISMFIGRGQ